MDINTQFTQFRKQVYQNFNKYKRADILMDLVDAISSNISTRTVVELALNPLFRRHYTAIFKAISSSAFDDQQLARLAGPTLPQPQKRPFYLLGVDVTSQPRLYARTLSDRSFVHQPTVIRCNKPISVGHQYSLAAALPEKEAVKQPPAWVVPLAFQRVGSQENKELVGARQIDQLLSDPNLPFQQALCAEVEDSAYCKPEFLHANRKHANLVTIVRVRTNRTFYRMVVGSTPSAEAGKGHPTWFGVPFQLSDATTWPTSDEEIHTTFTSRRGRSYSVVVQAWHNLLMHGKTKPERIPMHEHPFTLVRVCLYDPDGKLAFTNPLWLLAIGKHRRELSALEIYQAYGQRYDLEHFFRFGKQKLLLDAFQTPVTQHEENWWRLVALAYLQLWAARPCVQSLPRPWEQYLPATQNKIISPTTVQRDLPRIIRQIGIHAPVPKRRGKSPGRSKATTLKLRPRLPVVKKAKT
jgi:hypothetical protein